MVFAPLQFSRTLMRTLLGGIVICSSAQAFDGFDDVMGSYLNGAFPDTDPAQSGAAVPQTLSATGAFSHVGTLQPAPGLISYEVNSPLWSDGAVKKRWIAIPSDGNRNSASEQIEFRANEPWTFPVGTVAIKHFEMPNDESNPFSTERLETRFGGSGHKHCDYEGGREHTSTAVGFSELK